MYIVSEFKLDPKDEIQCIVLNVSVLYFSANKLTNLENLISFKFAVQVLLLQ